jgi:CRISPR/Cas system CSM-associated protein Csm3 (group 7 of RAMP superfamily)
MICWRCAIFRERKGKQENKMSDSQRSIRLELAGFWRAGGGRSSGYHLDSLCERDRDGLPFLPGRQLKGVIRHALARAEAWGWFADNVLPEGPCATLDELLFGSVSQQHERANTWPGMLIIGDATLSQAERGYLAQPQQAALREALFEQLFSTAIEDSGGAKAGSLRGAEVALPMVLFAPVSLELTALESERREQQRQVLTDARVWQAVEASLSLVDAIGAGRTRGLGEAQLSLLARAEEVI